MLILQLLFQLSALANYELQETVVTAERFEKKYQNSTSSITSFDQYEIERSGLSTLGDFLKSRSSIAVTNNGGMGTASNLYLRGTENRHTLLLIDGVEYTNPTNISPSADWALIPLSNIEKIEILKGSQSALYGSGAIGGVIKITTKSIKNSRDNFSFGVGSYSLREFKGETYGNEGRLSYSLAGSFLRTEGISAFNERRTVGADQDGFQKVFLTPKIKFDISKDQSLTFLSRFRATKTEVDNYGSDSTNFSDFQSEAYSLLHRYRLSDTLELDSQANFVGVEREDSGFTYIGNRKEIKSDLRKKWGAHSFVTGVEIERDQAKNLGAGAIDRDKDQYSAFFVHDYKLKGLSADWGIRFTEDELAGNYTTLKLGTAYFFKGIGGTLKGQVASGFMAPSLYQVYSSFGNAELKAEKSRSYQVGWLQQMSFGTFELTYFKISYDELISFNSATNRYYNEGKSESRGLEFNSKVIISSDFYTNFSLTTLRARNLTTGNYLQQRPEKTFSLGLGWFVADGKELELIGRYVGRRDDFNNVPMGGYTLFDLNFTSTFANNWSIALFVGNILDREYERVLTYGTMGRNFKLSVSRSF